MGNLAKKELDNNKLNINNKQSRPIKGSSAANKTKFKSLRKTAISKKNSVINADINELEEIMDVLSSNNLHSKEISDIIAKLENDFEEDKVSNPFSDFMYSSEKTQSEIIKDVFENINKSIHYLKLKGMNAPLDFETVTREKAELFSKSVINTLEENLDITLSEYQKKNFDTEITSISKNIDLNSNRLKEECDKLKAISSTKLLIRPRYESNLSKAKIDDLEDRSIISPLKFNFLKFKSSTQKERNVEIKDNLLLHIKSLKDAVLEDQLAIKKRMKHLLILIGMSTAVMPLAPTAGVTGIAAIGTAALIVECQRLIINDKMNKLDSEIDSLENGSSKLVESINQKLIEASNELLEQEDYTEICNLYVTGKKKMISEKELKEKIEEQMRISIMAILALNNENKVENEVPDLINTQEFIIPSLEKEQSDLEIQL